MVRTATTLPRSIRSGNGVEVTDTLAVGCDLGRV